MSRFFLSFHNASGYCRISHGDDLESAIQDCLQTAAGTGLTSTLLDADFKSLGSVETIYSEIGSSFRFVAEEDQLSPTL